MKCPGYIFGLMLIALLTLQAEDEIWDKPLNSFATKGVDLYRATIYHDHFTGCVIFKVIVETGKVTFNFDSSIAGRALGGNIVTQDLKRVMEIAEWIKTVSDKKPKPYADNVFMRVQSLTGDNKFTSHDRYLPIDILALKGEEAVLVKWLLVYTGNFDPVKMPEFQEMKSIKNH